MSSFTIGKRAIGPGYPTYVIAEMSGNHGQSFEQAIEILKAAKEAGADAVKLQTYTADTITIDSDNPEFKINGGLWHGRNLYELYQEAHTPWEWQPRIKAAADELGIDCFSSPFDESAVDFLEAMNVPAYKIASFEMIDTGLLRKVASTGKPIILSTGMATYDEIDESVKTLRESGATEIALLKCTSAYPALPEDMNLLTIPHLASSFGVISGLSDHTLGYSVAIASVALGANIVEKHFTLSRDEPGPDSAFSMEPSEFAEMVDAIRTVEKAIGTVKYGGSKDEEKSRIFRRSLYAVKNIQAGEKFSPENVRSIRPGYGLAPKYLDEILSSYAKTDISLGTPLSRDHIS